MNQPMSSSKHSAMVPVTHTLFDLSNGVLQDGSTVTLQTGLIAGGRAKMHALLKWGYLINQRSIYMRVLNDSINFGVATLLIPG